MYVVFFAIQFYCSSMFVYDENGDTEGDCDLKWRWTQIKKFSFPSKRSFTEKILPLKSNLI